MTGVIEGPEPDRAASAAKAPSTLKKRADFLRVAAVRRKWVTPGFILQVAPANQNPAELRFGITASRKVGNAVTRNRAKRRLRALAREVLGPTGLPGHDYVMIARTETATRPYDLLKADLKTALNRLKVSHFPENGPKTRSEAR